MNKIPIIPIEERFQWIVPAAPYYLILLAKHMIYTVYQDHGLGWPESLLFFHGNGKCNWYGWQKETDANGIKATDEVLGKQGRLRKLKKQYDEYACLLKGEDKKIKLGKLKELDNNDIVEYYLEYLELLKHYWHGAIMPELIGYGTGAYLARELKKIYSPEKTGEYLNILTSPDDFSFFQKEELALSKILRQIKNAQSLNTNTPKDFVRKLTELEPNIVRLLTRHTFEYNWILNNYTSGKPLPKSYFFKRAWEEAKGGKTPREKIAGIRKKFRQLQRTKKKIIAKLPNKDLQFYAQAAGIGVAWHDDRKANQLRHQVSCHYFLKEFSRRFKVSFNDLLFMMPEEITAYLKGKVPIPKREIQKRKKFFLVYIKPRSYSHRTDKTARIAFDKYLEHLNTRGIQETIGVVASKGKEIILRGRVRKALSPGEAKKLQPGEILVAEMTSPDYIVAIRKAAAIITDAGGLTSHAAVVARELNIPCLVNTKTATAVFADGDMVEIDMSKGVVKKLK